MLTVASVLGGACVFFVRVSPCSTSSYEGTLIVFHSSEQRVRRLDLRTLEAGLTISAASQFLRPLRSNTEEMESRRVVLDTASRRCEVSRSTLRSLRALYSSWTTRSGRKRSPSSVSRMRRSSQACSGGTSAGVDRGERTSDASSSAILTPVSQAMSYRVGHHSTYEPAPVRPSSSRKLTLAFADPMIQAPTARSLRWTASSSSTPRSSVSAGTSSLVLLLSGPANLKKRLRRSTRSRSWSSSPRRRRRRSLRLIRCGETCMGGTSWRGRDRKSVV